MRWPWKSKTSGAKDKGSQDDNTSTCSRDPPSGRTSLNASVRQQQLPQLQPRVVVCPVVAPPKGSDNDGREDTQYNTDDEGTGGGPEELCSPQSSAVESGKIGLAHPLRSRHGLADAGDDNSLSSVHMPSKTDVEQSSQGPISPRRHNSLTPLVTSVSEVVMIPQPPPVRPPALPDRDGAGTPPFQRLSFSGESPLMADADNFGSPFADSTHSTIPVLLRSDSGRPTATLYDPRRRFSSATVPVALANSMTSQPPVPQQVLLHQGSGSPLAILSALGTAETTATLTTPSIGSHTLYDTPSPLYGASNAGRTSLQHDEAAVEGGPIVLPSVLDPSDTQSVPGEATMAYVEGEQPIVPANQRASSRSSPKYVALEPHSSNERPVLVNVRRTAATLRRSAAGAGANSTDVSSPSSGSGAAASTQDEGRRGEHRGSASLGHSDISGTVSLKGSRTREVRPSLLNSSAVSAGAQSSPPELPSMTRGSPTLHSRSLSGSVTPRQTVTFSPETPALPVSSDAAGGSVSGPSILAPPQSSILHRGSSARSATSNGGGWSGSGYRKSTHVEEEHAKDFARISALVRQMNPGSTASAVDGAGSSRNSSSGVYSGSQHHHHYYPHSRSEDNSDGSVVASPHSSEGHRRRVSFDHSLVPDRTASTSAPFPDGGSERNNSTSQGQAMGSLSLEPQSGAALAKVGGSPTTGILSPTSAPFANLSARSTSPAPISAHGSRRGRADVSFILH